MEPSIESLGHARRVLKRKSKLTIVAFVVLGLLLLGCSLRISDSEEECTDFQTEVNLTVLNSSNEKTYWVNIRGEINLDDNGKNGKPKNYIGDTVVEPKQSRDFTLILPPRTSGFIVKVYQVEYNQVDRRIETVMKTYRSDNVCL